MKNLIRSLKSSLSCALYVAMFLMEACAPPSLEDSDSQLFPFDARDTFGLNVPSVLSINELLFDPLGDGVDFVEVVNVSSKILEMSRFRLANRNTKGEVANIKTLPSKTLPPGAYLLLCSDTARLAQDYPLSDSVNVLIVKKMPSYANAGGCVVLLDEQAAIVDEFPYNPDYHHPLVSDAESLSLEKLHPSLSSLSPSSWTTAALDAGGATPGYLNSQYRRSFDSPLNQEGFYLENNACCPQALSTESQCLLRYRFSDIYVATVRLYDFSGFPCATLANNLLLGSEGCLLFPGVDDDGNALYPGCYLLKITAYTLDGKLYRETFVIRIWPA